MPLQGLSERMAKVICTAGVFIFTKSLFSQLFPLQNWRQITPPAHPGPSGSFSALPQRWQCLFMREEEGKGRPPRETSAQLSAILDNLGDLETRSPNNGEDYWFSVLCFCHFIIVSYKHVWKWCQIWKSTWRNPEQSLARPFGLLVSHLQHDP